MANCEQVIPSGSCTNRLFPSSRHLCHAYNVLTGYRCACLDMKLVILSPRELKVTSFLVVYTGERLGERVLVEHILPSVRSILSVGLELSSRPSAMIDAMSVLDRIIVLLPPSVLLPELLQVCTPYHFDLYSMFSCTLQLKSCL